MPIGTVLEKSFSSGGKAKAHIQTNEDKRWYFWPEGSDVNDLIGKRIDFEAGSFSFNDKKTGKLIVLSTVKKWALAQDQTQSSAPQPIQERIQEAVAPFVKVNAMYGGGALYAPGPTQQALSTLFDHELRFISNVVGQAITAGFINEPSKVQAWFKAAQGALGGRTEDVLVPQPEVFERDAEKRLIRSNETKSANIQATRILDAVKLANDRLVLEVWDECSHLKTSEEFEASVWSLLPKPVQNHVQDLRDTREIGF